MVPPLAPGQMIGVVKINLAELTHIERCQQPVKVRSDVGRGGRLNTARSWSRVKNSSRPFMARAFDVCRVGRYVVVQVGAQENQAGGAALAVGISEAGLSAADLRF